MACDPQTLTTNYRCLAQGMSAHQLIAAWAVGVCGSSPTPPADSGILTDPDNETILTDDGLVIVPD